jgi:hypothetical protein
MKFQLYLHHFLLIQTLPGAMRYLDPLRFIALVTEPDTAKEILQSMGLPTELPPIAKARSPDFYQETFPTEWD